MRSLLGPLGLLLGCNQVFGLESTMLPATPEVGCPALGVAPTFAPVIHELTAQPCQSYTTSSVTGRALADCPVATSMPNVLVEGAIDGTMLVPITIASTVSGTKLVSPSLFPEGDRLLVEQLDARRVVRDVWSVYHREPADQWIHDADLAFPGTAVVGSVSAGPDRRVLVVDSVALMLSEWSSPDGVTWTELVDHAGPFYNASRGPQLSADGLRYVSTAGSTGMGQLLYADRASVDVKFNPPVPLDVPAEVNDGFLTDDCSRLYFSQAGGILFVNAL